MTDSERASAIQRLVDGRDALLRTVDGLSAQQLAFRSEAGRWSIEDCVEHIAVTEDVLFDLVAGGVANPEGVSFDPAKDDRLAAAIVSRERKVQAPERVRPKGRLRIHSPRLRPFPGKP